MIVAAVAFVKSACRPVVAPKSAFPVAVAVDDQATLSRPFENFSANESVPCVKIALAPVDVTGAVVPSGRSTAPVVDFCGEVNPDVK